jgi:hypothetical protein
MERRRSETLKLFVVSDVGHRRLTPFFHTIHTIVEIFLAKVSRAISGRYTLGQHRKNSCALGAPPAMKGAEPR